MQANRETVALFQAIAEAIGYEQWVKVRDKLIERRIPYVDPFANGTDEQRHAWIGVASESDTEMKDFLRSALYKKAAEMSPEMRNRWLVAEWDVTE